MRTFEDFTVGEIIAHGTHTFGADEIVAFADLYDPEPIHRDPQAAETVAAGGLVASGWHVAAAFMRLMADAMLLDAAGMGSPGIETLKWSRPIRPGDTIRAQSTVLNTHASQTRPEMGLVRFRHEAFDARGETVMTIENAIMFARRRGAGA